MKSIHYQINIQAYAQICQQQEKTFEPSNLILMNKIKKIKRQLLLMIRKNTYRNSRKGKVVLVWRDILIKNVSEVHNLAVSQTKEPNRCYLLLLERKGVSVKLLK